MRPRQIGHRFPDIFKLFFLKKTRPFAGYMITISCLFKKNYATFLSVAAYALSSMHKLYRSGVCKLALREFYHKLLTADIVMACAIRH